MKWQKIDAPEISLDKLGAAVDSGRLAHCILLTGATADTRKKAALNIAAALLCENTAQRPCGKCASCRKVKEKVHTDVRITEVPDGKKFIPLDSVKEEIIANANIIPADGKYNVFIICEASDMREEAANALLKTIEEPAEFTRFILTSGSRAAVLPTILSRCEEFSLGEEKESISGASAKKIDEIASAVIAAVLKKDEREIMFATSPLTKNRVLTGRVCEKIKLVLRDALAGDASEGISGLGECAEAVRRNTDINTIMKLNGVLDGCLDDIEISCNENLLLCTLSRGLAEAVCGKKG